VIEFERSSQSFNAATNLIAFNGFEESSKISFPEPVVSLALDDFVKKRPHKSLREDLQKVAFRISIDQDGHSFHFTETFRNSRDPLVEHLVVRVRGSVQESESLIA
jgi:hypothetical protein